jgi:lysophospholipase L1-like esterase
VDGVAAVLLLGFVAVVVAACGGTSVAKEPPGKIVVAALGDSITAGSPGYDPDPVQRKFHQFGDNPQSQWEYWAQQKDPRLEFHNCGVYGERTDDIALRLDACAKGASVLIVQGGINDIAQDYPVAHAALYLRRMVRRGKEFGLRVALTDVLPWNNGYPTYDPKIKQLNKLIRGIASDERVPLIPFHDTIDDPKHPGRMPVRLTADGDHPSVEGYRLLGEKAFRLPQVQAEASGMSPTA